MHEQRRKTLNYTEGWSPPAEVAVSVLEALSRFSTTSWQHRKLIAEAAWPSLREGATLIGQDATEAIDRGIEVATAFSSTLRLKLTAYRYLQYLRIVPDRVFGQYQYQGSYHTRRQMTEILSAQSPAEPVADLPDSLIDGIPLVSPWDRHLNEVLDIGLFTAGLMVDRFCAIKGIPVQYRSWSLYPITDAPQWASIRAHDARRNQTSDQGLILGTSAHMHKPPKIYNPEFLMALMPVDHNPISPYSTTYEFRSIQWKLPDLLSGYRWYHRELPYWIYLSQALAMMTFAIDPSPLGQLHRQGYYVIERRGLMDLLLTWAESDQWKALASAFPDARVSATGTGELVRLLTKPATVRPLRSGPILRPVRRDLVAVDFVALTANLQMTMMSSPEAQDSRGENVRAKGFEIDVQDAIDNKQWRPPPDLRQLVGRAIRRPDKSRLTDIDAVAALGSTCILVDCKSYQRQGLHDGDYKATRNVHTDLLQDVISWEAKVSRIREVPNGANYDLSRYSRILGLVVIPGLYYMPAELAERMIAPELRAVLTLAEFLIFLKLPQT